MVDGKTRYDIVHPEGLIVSKRHARAAKHFAEAHEFRLRQALPFFRRWLELENERQIEGMFRRQILNDMLADRKPSDQQIEQVAPLIEHDYNRDTPVHLDQHTDDWNRKIQAENEQRRRDDEAYWARHRQVTVTAGDGFATIQVQAPHR